MPKIVVVGSSNVDLIMKMDRLPVRGETVTDAEFLQVYGGKGANQAVAAARAGGQVAFVNCVGTDAYTPQMVQNFRDDGIDTTYVFREEGRNSGHALVMIGSEGANYLSVAPGTNYALSPARIDEALPLIERAGLLLLQYEIPAETIAHTIRLAEQRGIPLLWNFAPARDFDLRYLSGVAILVVNEVEAGFLAGQSVSSREEAESAAQVLLDRGATTVIITLGKGGCLLTSAKEQLHVPAFEVEAVDTTAAGDVFCGAFGVAYLEGKSSAECLRFASAAAALSVTRLGAQPSAPTREAIDKFLAAR